MHITQTSYTFDKMIPFVSPYLPIGDAVLISCSSKKMQKIMWHKIIKEHVEEKIYTYFQSTLNQKINNISLIVNPYLKNMMEERFFQRSFLEKTVTAGLKNLRMPIGDFTYACARDCLHNYFLEACSEHPTLTHLLTLKQFALHHLKTEEMHLAIKILNRMPSCYTKTHLINRIFIFFSQNPDPESLYDEKKLFMKIMMDEGKYAESFRIAVQYNKTPYEKPIVTFILTELFDKNKINISLKFIGKNYPVEHSYFLIIPELFLKEKKVGQALRAAHKINDMFCDHPSLNPYENILDAIIDYQLENKEMEGAVDTAFLLSDQENLENKLIVIIKKCFEENKPKLAAFLLSMLELKESQAKIRKNINEMCITNYLNNNDLYKKINDIFKKNTVDTSEISKVINNYKKNNRLDLNKYKVYFKEKALTPEEMDSEIFKTLIFYYLKNKQTFIALEIAKLIPQTRDRGEQLYLIIQYLGGIGQSPEEKRSHPVSPYEVFDMIDDPAYKKLAKRFLRVTPIQIKRNIKK